MRVPTKKRARRVDTLADVVADFHRFVIERQLDLSHGGKTAAVALYSDELRARRRPLPPAVVDQWATPSPKTLYNEFRRWEAEPLDALKDRRSGDHNRDRGFFHRYPEHRHHIELLLKADAKPKSVRYSNLELFRRFETACIEQGLSPIPSFRQVRIYRENWRAENGWKALIADEPEQFKAKVKPAPGNSNEHITRPNELVQFDFSKANTLSKDGPRLWMAGAIDVFTRTVVVMLCDVPSAQATCDLLREYIKTYGVPKKIKIDNGKEFINGRFEKATKALGIEVERTPRYSGNLKAEIERFWRTLCEQVFPGTDAYTGSNPAERQALRERTPFARRGHEEKVLAERALNRDQLAELIQDFVIVYNNTEHRSLGMSPAQMRAKHRGSWAKLDPEQVPAVTLLLGRPAGRGTATITKSGLHVGGRLYQAAELWTEGTHGDRVLVMEHPEKAGAILVFRSNEEFLCEATDPELMEISRQEFAAIVDQQTSKRVKEIRAEFRAAKRAVNSQGLHIAGMKRRANQFRNVIELANVEAHDAPGLVGAQQALEAMTARTNATDRAATPRQPTAIDFDSGDLKVFPIDSPERFEYWCALHDRIEATGSIHPKLKQWHDANADDYGLQLEREFALRAATGTDGPKSNAR